MLNLVRFGNLEESYGFAPLLGVVHLMEGCILQNVLKKFREIFS